MSRVLVTTDYLHPGDEVDALLRNHGHQVSYRPAVVPRDAEEALALFDGIDGAIVASEPVTAEMLDRATDLAVLARSGVGYDSIDVTAAVARGIRVCHERFERGRHNLSLVGLGDKLDHLPAELSGGEQQRAAIARALATDPKLIVGDEPTGNLDTVTAAEMFELFERLNEEGKTVLYVTHDLELARRAHRIVSIRDGVIVAS